MSIIETQSSLMREDFTEERVLQFARIAEQAGFRVTTKEEREANRRATIDRVKPGEDIWIFGCGSLMWNPALRIEESRQARIFGLSVVI